MPSSMTHSYFCVDVYNKLDQKIKKNISKYIPLLKAFAQGPDPYFFYDFHLTRRSKKVFEMDRAMQHTKINEHFLSLINYINKKKYYSDPFVMSYLIGQICHYSLDSTAHPYIVYFSGKYDKNDKNSYKYNGLHEKIEYAIDNYFISERENIEPSKFKVHREVFDIYRFNDNLKDTIDTVLKKVYNFENGSTIYYKSLSDMKKFYHVFNYDRWGIKKRAYHILDLICKNKTVKKEELSFHIKKEDTIKYMNIDKKTWFHPCNGKEKYNYSFNDLYYMALDKAVLIINEVFDMFEKNKIDDSKIKELFGDLDYGTGKNWKLNLDFKYFDF